MADGKLCYNPDIFRVRNLDEARRIILTNEGPADTGECRHLRPDSAANSISGRTSSCSTTAAASGGVDISPEMRAMARDDVDIRELTAQFFSLSSTPAVSGRSRNRAAPGILPDLPENPRPLTYKKTIKGRSL